MLIMKFMGIASGKSIFHHHHQNSKNPHVESGFIKIQNIDTSNMTVEEHTACQHLRLNNNYGNNENENNDYDLYEKRRILFKLIKKNVNYDYGNCNFILGSSAVFEHLWSMANKRLGGNRSRTYPLLM